MKYILSKCFPRMNDWITEQLLQEEVRTNERIREEFEQAARLQRQRDGEITGYSIKTKRHSKMLAPAGNDEKSNIVLYTSGDGPTIGIGATSTDATSPSKCSEDSSAMCTICLLELEDGDRIADLGCGHFYHAECLGEWVLKKVNHHIVMCSICSRYHVRSIVPFASHETPFSGYSQNSCPLCQDQGIATEIRHYETTDDGNGNDTESRRSRWRRKTRRMFLNIATGGHPPTRDDQIPT